MVEASTSNETALERNGTQGLSRRQLVAAGAWAAPALVLATAAPASAAQSSAAITVTLNASDPVYSSSSGNSQAAQHQITTWTLTVTVSNPSANPRAAAPTVTLQALGDIHSQSPAGSPSVTVSASSGNSTTSSTVLQVATLDVGRTITVTATVTFGGGTEVYPFSLVGSPRVLTSTARP